MKRNFKVFLVLALALVCAFQFVGINAVTASADDGTDIYWAAFSRNNYGGGISVDNSDAADDIVVKVGSATVGKGASNKNLSLSELLEDGLTVEAPEGYYVKEVVIADARGLNYSFDPDDVNLLKFAPANTSSPKFSIDADDFEAAEEDDIDLIPNTRDNKDFCILVSIAAIPFRVNVAYRAGALALTGELVQGAGWYNSFMINTMNGTSHTVLDLLSNQKEAAAALNKELVGWTVEYANGAKGTIEVGETLDAYTGCTLTAIWDDFASVTVTADSASKDYDGTPLTDDGYTISNEKLPENYEVTVTVEGSQTEAGTSENVPTVVVTDKNNNNAIVRNVKITTVKGTLTVNKLAIGFTADSDSKDYDGTPLTKATFTKSFESLPEGHTLTDPTVSGTITDAGSVENTISGAVIKNAAGEDVTSSFDITYTSGTLTVKPIEIEITADSAEQDYNGSALTKNTWKVTKGEDKLPEGFKVDSVTVTGTITDAGTVENVPSDAVIKNGDTEVELDDNFVITYVKGSLTVKPIEIEITADSAEQTYNGSALTKNTWKITKGEDKLPEGYKVESVTVTGSQTELGSSKNVASAAVIKNGDTVLDSENYTVTYVDGTLTVKAIEIEITAASASKTHDGTALTKNEYSVTSGALLNGHSFKSVTVTGSQTDVGESKNVASAAVIIDAEGKDVTAYYNIAYKDGKLVVNQQIINLTLTAKSAEKQYDGTALTKNEYEITSGALLSGHTLEVTITGTITDAGEVENKITVAKVKSGDTDVSAMYKITTVSGKLKVTQIPLVVTAKSGEKVWDGKALVVNSCTVAGSIVSGHTVSSVTVTGSQTAIGSSNNVPSAAIIKDASGKDVTANYKIEYKNGTLTVKAATDKPSTGDNNNLGLWVGLMACSAVLVGATVGLVYFTKKRKSSN